MTHIWEPFRKQGAIDLVAFLGQWPFRHQSQSSIAEIAEMSDKYGLSSVCVSHISSIFGFDTRSGNEALLAACSQDTRMKPFIIINPGQIGWEQELMWAMDSGAAGVRLTPSYHGYRLTDKHAIELLEKLVDMQLPLQICVRLQDLRLQHPQYIMQDVQLHDISEWIMMANDRLPLLISGINKAEWDHVQLLLNDNFPQNNLYGDLWFVNGPLAVVASICKEGFAGQFAYSSCFPIQNAGATVMQIMAAHIQEDERSSLSVRNAQRFLKTES